MRDEIFTKLLHPFKTALKKRVLSLAFLPLNHNINHKLRQSLNPFKKILAELIFIIIPNALRFND